MADGSFSPLLDLDGLIAATRPDTFMGRPVIHPDRFNEAADLLAVEIERLTGCDAKAASKAAGSYLSSPSLPMASLGDWSEGQYLATVEASAALRQWLAVRGIGEAA